MKNLFFLIVSITVIMFSCESEKEKGTSEKKNDSIIDTITVADSIIDDEERVSINDLIYNQYSEYYSEDDEIPEAFQHMLTINGQMAKMYEIYEGGNGEGDEGIILICTFDENNMIIDYTEYSNGYFGDVTEVWSEFDLIPGDFLCIHTEENGLNNVDFDEENGFTGDPYNTKTYDLLIIDDDGFFGAYETGEEMFKVQEDYLNNKNDVLVKDVRRYYQIIEKKVADGSFGSYTYRVGDNETFEYLFDDSDFNKIIHKKTDGAGTLFQDEYYFVGNELFFVFAVNNEKASEGRYYYHKNELKVALIGKDKNSLSSTEISKSDFSSKKIKEIREIRETIVGQMD